MALAGRKAGSTTEHSVSLYGSLIYKLSLLPHLSTVTHLAFRNDSVLWVYFDHGHGLSLNLLLGLLSPWYKSMPYSK